MGIMVHSVLWVMQDLYHQPYHLDPAEPNFWGPRVEGFRVEILGYLGFRGIGA